MLYVQLDMLLINTLITDLCLLQSNIYSPMNIMMFGYNELFHAGSGGSL